MISSKRKAIAYWLLLGVFMIIVQVLLGGITRLTGSGLSITEWNPIMGALPPLNEQHWNEAFSHYKQIAQFKYVNSHFSLDDFKSIFFWEWLHRLWARSLGVVFAIGFIYFLVRKYFDKEMVIPFIILFILGAAQGLVGWIMVQSGLNDTDLHVSHIRLAVHFIAALILLCYTLWFALQLLVPEEKRVESNSLSNFTLVTILLLTVQLVYGAFMAGIKAAPSAPTWPTINGEWIPRGIGGSWISDPINIQFIHRQLAYLLFTVIILWFGAAGRISRKNPIASLTTMRWWPFLLVWSQVILGILTVLSAPKMTTVHFGQFEILAELHQMVAMFLLVFLVICLYLVKRSRRQS